MPKLEQKQVIVKEIKKTLEGASSVVLVNFRGLSVEQDTNLRKELRNADVTYKVFKNTMMRFAFEGTDFEQLDKELVGPNAVAISYDDPIAGPRVLKKMSKDIKKLELKSGVVEGIYYDHNGIEQLASIPTREELLAKLLGSFKSPISTFARTMKALSEKMEEENVELARELVGKVEASADEEAEKPEADAGELD